MRIWNAWKKAGDYQTFSIFNIWYGPEYWGITIFNLAIEFSRPLQPSKANPIEWQKDYDFLVGDKWPEEVAKKRGISA